MPTTLSKPEFLADLRTRIHQHSEIVTTLFQPVDDGQLTCRPAPKEWNILQCFDHLNLTHDYYDPRVHRALGSSVPSNQSPEAYKPSFWGRIYMHFAFNPKYSFPTADEITPGTVLARDVFTVYLAKQDSLLGILDKVDGIHLSKTPIPIERGFKFNLGDCLKILVYHDALHIRQARGILASLENPL